MRALTRSVWAWTLLASVLWMIGGTFITSDAFDQGRVGSEVTSGLKSLASGASIQVANEIPLPLFFLLTGLPFALVSLYFLWRRSRGNAASAASSERSKLRRQTIMVTILALIFALALWNIGDVERGLRRAGVPGAEQVDDLSASLIVYPVRLFVTFVHEAGHSLAALLTGGQVAGFEVSPDGSGSAMISGGSIALIAPAGYLGAALFGSLLFFLTNRIPRWTRGLSFVIGIAIIALTLAFAMPNGERSPTALIVGIGFGVGLMALGWFAPRMVNVFVLNTLAFLTGLNAVFDILLLVRFPDAGNGVAVNDAARFSQEVTWDALPPAMVALIWAACAVAMLGCAIYFGLIKQVSGEIKNVVNGGKTKPAAADKSRSQRA